MIYKKEFICNTENDTKKLAESFAKIAKKGDIFALYGTLGVGKSCFSRYFIKTIVDVNDVPSPTFTLVQTYDADNFIIYHYDMYRLKTPDEAYELGVEDSFYDGVNLIEWPEKIEYVLPKKSWKIYIKVEENIRYFEIIVEKEEQQQRLEKIEI